MLLRFGGFVNYDRDGRVIGVRTVTENRTQHMLMFGPPEFLRPEDVDRSVSVTPLLGSPDQTRSGCMQESDG
jgi:hypothetical protein